MEYWSPEHAMKAYLQTLKLCKDYYTQDGNLGKSRRVEPKCMEYISALAAGIRARLMVEITFCGISPLTIALAVAAKQTGGRVICILHKNEELSEAKTRIADFDIKDSVEFVIGDPCEVIKQYKCIDFAIIDCRIHDHLKVYKIIDMNPSGSVVVVDNFFHRKIGASYGQVVKGIGGVESVILPIGEGMEVTRVGWGKRDGSKRSKRRNIRQLKGGKFY
ncbi:uncharacterized protein LOC143864710 [Tasmannia lanceolata]|uniref:uncharacterized protein LOC143864710 n=1 Tax=Tasmannia lanceolata TaxID=3420 RepID=UPI004063FD91